MCFAAKEIFGEKSEVGQLFTTRKTKLIFTIFQFLTNHNQKQVLSKQYDSLKDS